MNIDNLKATLIGDKVFLEIIVEDKTYSFEVWKSHLDSLASDEERRNYLLNELQLVINSSPIPISLPIN